MMMMMMMKPSTNFVFGTITTAAAAAAAAAVAVVALLCFGDDVNADSTYRISLYGKTNFQGDQATFTTDGSHKVGWSGGAQSWIYESEPGDGCCIAFCRGSTNVGRYCDSAYKTESSAGTNKVVTGYGDTVLNC
ncbi:uncharacterized protein PV06_02085 [Exophiala oligosperma]|uniref:Uncharacterized protein n=1 Tax=Exophiala oligosperma TaxID=215243 RepID=A0A0D2DTH0_9EURO|nr:uncharacterized protein PV06_02085 [Exophiala oligosperma]KIW46413.1 hypothetical protein PV06_02085 [Exophiala oligosperma]